MKQRVIELEKKAAFQDRAIEELNEVLMDQQKKIDKLEAYLMQLKEQFNNENFFKNPGEEELPPHY